MASNTLSQLVVASLIVSIAAVSCSKRAAVEPIATLEQIRYIPQMVAPPAAR